MNSLPSISKRITEFIHRKPFCAEMSMNHADFDGKKGYNYQFVLSAGKVDTTSPNNLQYADITANSPLWVSPEQLDMPNVHLQQFNSSESVCTLDTGSDLFSKRDVIHRLREQLKRRDEMIMEMQAQITDQL